jgi:hypothetical protein
MMMGLVGQACVSRVGEMKHACHILLGNVEGKKLLGRYSLTPKEPEYSLPCFKKLPLVLILNM